jgi:hypothetical protein
MLKSIGPGGDGDEVDAIERVEAEFEFLFDHDDRETFVTVGDVWRALLKELSLDEASAEAEAAWPVLVGAPGDETLREDRFPEVGVETRLI